ncbi:MAG: PQQ-binding-like beta-propeller repeat protein [Planctomycetaceae bacterium]|nr:PQQ-binding-like beta-propeller repeat protein [Planctomycetaceae bacterium]
MNPSIILVILWTAAIGDSPEAGYSSAVPINDRIYITANHDGGSTVFCLNAANGQPLWTYRNGPAWPEMFAGTRSTPLIDNKFLYDESPHGKIVCLDTATGKRIWSRNLLNDYGTPNTLYGRSGSLRIEGDRLFTQLGGERASMLCLDKKTGKTLWLGESTGNAAGYGSPVLFDFEDIPIIAAMDAKGLFAVNRKTGKLLFHFRHPARLDENITTPIYRDGKIFITNGAGSDSKLLKLSAQNEMVNAEEVWTNRLMSNAHQGVVLRNGLLYGATNKRGGGFACIRWDDGADVFLDRNIVRGSFDVADDIFFVLTEFGEIVVAKPAERNFDVLTRLQLPKGSTGQVYTHPVVSGNRLYVRVGQVLYCIERR